MIAAIGQLRTIWHDSPIAARSLLLVLAGALVAAAPASPAARPPVRECSAQEVHRLVAGFTAAFNVGNVRRLDTLFAADDGDGEASTPSFQWFSTGPPGARLGSAAKNRGTLMQYFASRHRRGERLALLWMSRGGNSAGYFHFMFHLRRRARDLRATAFEGKGAAICSKAGAQIAVWSVGRRIRASS